MKYVVRVGVWGIMFDRVFLILDWTNPKKRGTLGFKCYEGHYITNPNKCTTIDGSEIPNNHRLDV